MDFTELDKLYENLKRDISVLTEVEKRLNDMLNNPSDFTKIDAQQIKIEMLESFSKMSYSHSLFNDKLAKAMKGNEK